MKKFTLLVPCFLLIFSLIGCGSFSIESLGKAPVEMKTTVQKDPHLDVTYTVMIPKDWHSGSAASYSVSALPSSYEYGKVYDPSLLINIYRYPDRTETPGQPYKELFEGHPEKYEQELQELYKSSGATLSNFRYKFYKGTQGRILEVTLSYSTQDGVISYILCYREDIPYYAMGAFDHSKDFSSGEVIPWVMDSLQVEGTDG